MTTGACELRECGREVIDRRVAVADKEDTGARRRVPRITAAYLRRQSDYEKDAHSHRRHGRERNQKAMPGMANSAWCAHNVSRPVDSGCSLVGDLLAGGQSDSTSGTTGLPGAVPGPALTAHQIRHEANLRVTAVKSHDRQGAKDLRTLAISRTASIRRNGGAPNRLSQDAMRLRSPGAETLRLFTGSDRFTSNSYQLVAMYLVSRNSISPSWEPSRPMPLCFTPPKGAAGSEIKPRFKPTMPDSIASATASPLARSRV